MYGTRFCAATWFTDIAVADDTAPMISEQPSFSISLCAFCVASPALALSSSTISSTLRPGMPPFAFTASSATFAPRTSLSPSAAQVPVSGSCMPI